MTDFSKFGIYLVDGVWTCWDCETLGKTLLAQETKIEELEKRIELMERNAAKVHEWMEEVGRSLKSAHLQIEMSKYHEFGR